VINEKEFFEAIRGGSYDSMPKALRELFILAVNNQDEPTLTVHRYVRPTLIEDAAYLYRPQGINITMITNVKKAAAIFSRFYEIKIDVPSFLSSLQIFHNASAEQLQERFGNTVASLEVAVKRAAGKRGKTESDNQAPKNSREREIPLFKRKFGEVKMPYGDTFA